METRRTTVRDVRRANRSSLLTDLFHGGLQSRQQLAASTALSQASVSNLIGEMIEEGLVEEAGLVGSDGGRPRVLLRVRPSFRYVVGADVGETRVLVELYDLHMSRLAAVTLEHDDQPEQVAGRVLTGLREVIGQAGVAPADVLGFGVGVPGVVDRDGVVDSQSTGWDSVPLREMLRAGTEVPIFVENGAKTHGQAEMWFGAGRGARHAVIVMIGTGVGAAVVMDGRSYYRGANSNAGEWGHTTLIYDGDECRCGARGCLEAYIGAERIGRRLAAATGEAYGETLVHRCLELEAMPEPVRRVFEQTAGYLGAGLADLINLFSPERIVLGGDTGSVFGARFLPEIREAAARHALRRPYAQTSITLCELGTDAVAMGAATLPIAQLLAEGGLPGTTEPVLAFTPRQRRPARR
ncbi:putative NBD/HSP70 family sugar kinase [Paractinoplanes brasiliensis]|uniref:Putative NBD/HSP70 family sugar kinase n=1 Tax=Paractinoplanes brasiliensis TaxID=52695 RepID=A0A4R6K1C1_9ACTN|nr:putative NBD/HSP70 family sugar kinase [Actinoplanes brasiliensis]GID27320.1 sugar kinase [Actinoplanes brasiliensis]